MTNRTRAGVAWVVCLAALAGCAGGPHKGIVAFRAASYEESAVEFESDATKADKNGVRSNLRLGSASLAAGEWDIAQRAFANAAEVIEAFATNTGGQKVAAVVGRESARVFKGEPYERAMAWYYYGLTFYRQGDYDNARAAFANALFDLEAYTADAKGKPVKDKKTGKPVAERVENTFILGYFFLARSYLRSGDTQRAQETFAKVAKVAPGLVPSKLFDYETNARCNLIVIVEDGYGPVKYSTGPDRALIDFRPGLVPTGPPLLVVGDTTFTPVNTVDLYTLATQRQWQSFDTWRLTKSVAGTAMMAAGAGMMTMSSNRNTQYAGMGLMLAGAIAKAMAKSDDRHWEILPARVNIWIGQAPEGQYTCQAGLETYADLPVTGEEGVDTVFYFRVNTVPRVIKDINVLRAERAPATAKTTK